MGSQEDFSSSKKRVFGRFSWYWMLLVKELNSHWQTEYKKTRNDHDYAFDSCVAVPIFKTGQKRWAFVEEKWENGSKTRKRGTVLVWLKTIKTIIINERP